MRDVLCPMKGCDKMITRNDASINNHLRLSHKTTSEQRTRLRIRILGDMRQENALRKQQSSTQDERKRARDSGIS